MGSGAGRKTHIVKPAGAEPWPGCGQEVEGAGKGSRTLPTRPSHQGHAALSPVLRGTKADRAGCSVSGPGFRDHPPGRVLPGRTA